MVVVVLIVCRSVHLWVRLSTTDCIKQLLGSILVLLVTVPAHVKILDHVKIESFPTGLLAAVASRVC